MTAAECVANARAADADYQRVINGFVDAFRRALADERRRILHDPITAPGPLERLVAGVVSALCREVGAETSHWVGEIGTPVPFFPFPARSFEMRVRRGNIGC